MEESAILLTITQVAVAFVGFAGLVATFQFRNATDIKKSDARILEMIIHTGLLGAFISILPLMLSSFGIADSGVWALCSGFVCINYLLVLLYRFKGFKISKLQNRSSKFTTVFYIGICIIAIVINLLNALNIVFYREFGPFFIALVIPLCLVGFMFSRLLIRPILRQIKND